MVIAATLSFRIAIRRSSILLPNNSSFTEKSTILLYNETLLKFESIDDGEPRLKQEIEQLWKGISGATLGTSRSCVLVISEGLHEFGIFSIFLPGIEIPSSFSLKSRGRSLSFTVPLLSDLTIRGLNVCVVYALSGGKKANVKHMSSCEIRNKSKDIIWLYSPKFFAVPEIDEDMLWLSYWNFGNQLEPGNEVDVSVLVRYDYVVKGLGIEVVYGSSNQDEGVDGENNPFSWRRVIGFGGDLSADQLTRGVYLLHNHRQKFGVPLNGSKISHFYGRGFFEDIPSIPPAVYLPLTLSG